MVEPAVRGYALRMLLGRSVELGRISHFLRGVGLGRSGALLLVGEPGVGKTALLDAAALTEPRGLRVVRFTGVEMESELPFAGLSVLLDPFLGHLDSLPAPQAAALKGALGLGPPLPPGDRFTVSAAALSLLAEAAERSRLALVVDDAHWLDQASLDALVFVARRIAAEGIGILMTARLEPPVAVDRAAGIEVIRVEGLPPEDAAALVHDLADGPVAPDVVECLVEGTGGNPLALTEAIAALDAHQLAGRTVLPDPLPVGPGIVRALALRIQALSPETRQALLFAAAEPAHPALVRDLLDAQHLNEALERAERAGIISLGEGGVTFCHPLMRSCTYAVASPTERRAAHRSLAEAALAHRGSATDISAFHLAAAAEGPDEPAAAALVAAARRAAGRMGYAEAATIMQRAARLTPDAAAQTLRFFEAGTFALMGGRTDLAQECLALTISADDPRLAAAARIARAHLEMWTGRALTARELMVAEVDRLGPAGGPEAAIWLTDAALASAMAGELGRGLDLARKAEAVLGDASGPLAVCVATVRTNFAIITGEEGASARLGRRPDPLEALASDDSLMWHRVAWAIQTSTWADRPADALALAESLIGMGRARSAPSLLPFPLAARAEARVATGDWNGAYASGTAALELALETGHHSTAAFARCTLARVDAARGREQECRELIAAVFESLSRHEARAVVSYAHAALGLLDLGASRLDAALAELLQTHDAALAEGLACHGAIPYLPDLIEAAVRAERREIAQAALERLQLTVRPEYLRTMGAYERCTGLLETDHDAAVAHLRAAIDWEAKAGAPFERARSQLLLGERLRRIRRRTEAKEALLEAFGMFDALGAVPWAERAGDALGALGVRPRTTTAARSAELTPQELQVSRGVARGLSNREIAALLFLSVKTVEFHLHNAYGKLGVRSRTELTARLLAPTPPGAPPADSYADEHPTA